MPHRPSLPPVAAGEVIGGKYRVGEVIGAGGMGTVVAAEHVSFDQKVAIKFMHPEGGPQGLQRFHREANIVVQLRSEHVCRVLDHGTLASGDMYIVMEKLEGHDLDQLVQANGCAPVADAVEYVLQASEALAEAHLAGVVHRDLKPSNLFLTERPDGSPCIKLLDFGISKVRDAKTALTATGALLGSVHFMSPEQLDDAKAVDLRSDIWSLGATLHQLISGQLPFDAESLSEMAIKIMYDPPRDLAALGPQLEGISQVIARCLAKNPAERFDNLAELALALQPHAGDRARAYVDRIVGMYERTGWKRPFRSAPPGHTTTGDLSAVAAGDTIAQHAHVTMEAVPKSAGLPQFVQSTPAMSAQPTTASSPVTQPSPSRGPLVWLVGAFAMLALVAVAALFVVPAPRAESTEDDETSEPKKKKKKKRKKKDETEHPGKEFDTPYVDPFRKGDPPSWDSATSIRALAIDATSTDTRVFRMRFYKEGAQVVVVSSEDPLKLRSYYWQRGVLRVPTPFDSSSHSWEDVKAASLSLNEIDSFVVPKLPLLSEAEGVPTSHITSIDLSVRGGKAFWVVTTLHTRLTFDHTGGYVGRAGK